MPTPDISIIIATRNRAGVLSDTLGHLAKQQVHGLRWETVVVDNGSTDDTPQVLAQADQRLHLTAVNEPEAGKNRALNRALALARGALIVFTDDDIVPRPDWLGQLAAAASRWPAHGIFGGRIEPDYPAGTPPWLAAHPFAAIAFARFEMGDTERDIGDVSPFGPNYAVRATWLTGMSFREEMGPSSDPRGPLGDETDFLRQLRQRGARTVYVPAAVVRHRVEPHQLHFQWLLDRSFRAGRGAVCLAPDTQAPRLFGAPRYLWRQLAYATLAHLLSQGAGAQRRLDTGIALYHLRGQAHEYRHGTSGL